MSNKIKELFRRYETGEATQAERRLVESWFRQYEDAPARLDNHDRRALKQLDRDIELIIANSTTRRKAKGLLWGMRPWQHAAIWIGLLLIGMASLIHTLYRGTSDPADYVEHYHAMGVPVRYILPDSSEVYLGAGSRIRYAAKFAGELRKVDLDGEAFFKVKPDSLRPFLVSSDEIRTEVLGTSFKVDAFDKGMISVSVATGKVAVSKLSDGKEARVATLMPGERILWHRDKQQAIFRTMDSSAIEQWQKGDLVFDDEALGDVLAEIERRFGLNITLLDDELASYPINTMFSGANSLDQILPILSVIGKFQYSTKDGITYQITKAGGQ